jgi:protease PrsW
MLTFFSFLPVVVILAYTWFRDIEHPEPWTLLAKCFIGGALTTLLWRLFDFPSLDPIHIAKVWKDIFESFFFAAVPEEFVKLAMLYLLVWKSRDFDQRLDGIVYAVFVSVGFAAVENYMYVTHLGIATAVIRMYTAVPCHAICGIVMGYFFTLAKFSRQRKYHFYAYLMPVLVHGVYDSLISAAHDISSDPWFYIMVMFVLIWVMIRIWKFFDKKIAAQMEADEKEEIAKIIGKYEKKKKKET